MAEKLSSGIRTFYPSAVRVYYSWAWLRAASTLALESLYPTFAVTAWMRLRATLSWVPKCCSSSGVKRT